MPDSTYHQIHFAWAEPTLLGRVGPGPAASSYTEAERITLRAWRNRLQPALTVDYRVCLPDPADHPETLWARAYDDGQAALVYRWPGDIGSAHAWAIVGPAEGLTLPRVLSLHENPNTRPHRTRPPKPGWEAMPELGTPEPWERSAAPGAVRARDRRAADLAGPGGEELLALGVAAALERPDLPVRVFLDPGRADLWNAVQLRFLWGLHRSLYEVLSPRGTTPAPGWDWSLSTYDPVLEESGQHIVFGPPTPAAGPLLRMPGAEFRGVAERLVGVLREEGGDALAGHLAERGVPDAPTFGERRDLLADWLDPRPSAPRAARPAAPEPAADRVSAGTAGGVGAAGDTAADSAQTAPPEPSRDAPARPVAAARLRRFITEATPGPTPPDAPGGHTRRTDAAPTADRNPEAPTHPTDPEDHVGHTRRTGTAAPADSAEGQLETGDDLPAAEPFPGDPTGPARHDAEGAAEADDDLPVAEALPVDLGDPTGHPRPAATEAPSGPARLTDAAAPADSAADRNPGDSTRPADLADASARTRFTDTAQTDSAGDQRSGSPTGAMDPVGHADTAGPVTPPGDRNPGDPTDSAAPIGSADPGDPTHPTGRAEPTHLSDPSGAGAPTDPMGPTSVGVPTDSVHPGDAMGGRAADSHITGGSGGGGPTDPRSSADSTGGDGSAFRSDGGTGAIDPSGGGEPVGAGDDLPRAEPFPADPTGFGRRDGEGAEEAEDDLPVAEPLPASSDTSVGARPVRSVAGGDPSEDDLPVAERLPVGSGVPVEDPADDDLPEAESLPGDTGGGSAPPSPPFPDASRARDLPARAWAVQEAAAEAASSLPEVEPPGTDETGPQAPPEPAVPSGRAAVEPPETEPEEPLWPGAPTAGDGEDPDEALWPSAAAHDPDDRQRPRIFDAPEPRRPRIAPAADPEPPREEEPPARRSPSPICTGLFRKRTTRRDTPVGGTPRAAEPDPPRSDGRVRALAEGAFGGRPTRSTPQPPDPEEFPPAAERTPDEAPPLFSDPDSDPEPTAAPDYAAETAPEPSEHVDPGDNWPTQYADLPLARLERWLTKYGPEEARVDLVDARAAVRAERSELQRVRDERDHYHAELQDSRREVARLDRSWIDREDDEELRATGPRRRRWPARVLVVLLLFAFLATGLEAGARFGVGALDLLGPLTGAPWWPR
ncbi:hypothetical protein [Nocardiopsis protaetiae]|uniref:hypothetical protein n=1 Tax=Nocardiopsis protaetiae TaxID=3382270 RepID=UPI00387B2B78